MIKIDEEYMKLPREKRREHLRLEEDCIERIEETQYNKSGYSYYLKGLLAEYLDTNIPIRRNGKGVRVLLCHACNNAKCSNPRHLYWGTDKDNMIDSGTGHDRKVALYGEEGAKEQYSKASKKGAETCKERYGDNYFSKINNRKGKLKPEEHKKNISLGITKWWEKRKKNHG